MKNKIETKDAYLLYVGIILGAVLGVFGNVYADYFYETNKNEWWFSGTVLAVAVTFFTFLIIMMVLIIRWGIQIKEAKEEGKKKEESEGSNQIDEQKITTLTNEEKKEKNKLIFESVVRRYEQELERTDDLDSKASNIIGFIGVLAGIVSGFGAFTLKFPTNTAEIIVLSLFIASLVFLFSSFIIGLKAYFPKRFTVIPDPYFLIGKYENTKQEQIIRNLSDNYAVAVEDNMMANDGKCTNIKHSVWFLFISIVLFALFALGLGLST